MRNVIQVFQTTLTLTPRAPYRTHSHTHTLPHIFTKWTNCVDSNRMNYDSRLWVANAFFFRLSLFCSLFICFHYLVGLLNQTICDGLCMWAHFSYISLLLINSCWFWNILIIDHVAVMRRKIFIFISWRHCIIQNISKVFYGSISGEALVEAFLFLITDGRVSHQIH